MAYMRNAQAVLKNFIDNGVFPGVGLGGPLSGTTNGTMKNIAGYGSFYIDLTNGNVFINEGTAASPYWTPIGFDGDKLLAWKTDFRDGVGKAVADTAATATIPGSGIRVFGNDVTQTDSGLTVAIGTDGPIASLIASATSGKLAALGVGITTSVPYKPSSHGPLVVDALISNLSAITARRVFLGWLGTAADALATPFTGSTLTITMVQDDGMGLLVDTGLTATARFFAPHNKADEAATILTTATGVDTGVDLAAAGTYQRLRVEISLLGTMTCFIDKVEVSSIALAATPGTVLAPVLAITSLASATKTMLIKKFGAWGCRKISS